MMTKKMKILKLSDEQEKTFRKICEAAGHVVAENYEFVDVDDFTDKITEAVVDYIIRNVSVCLERKRNLKVE